MEKDDSSLKEEGILDHGNKSVTIHASIPMGEHVSLDKQSLERAAGIADIDIGNFQKITLDHATVSGDHPAGLVFSHNNSQLKTSDRTISLSHGSPKIESVHGLVSPNSKFIPVSLDLGHAHPDDHAELVKTATARVARWKGASLSRLSHDVEAVEEGGRKRHLVPTNVNESSSPTALLFHRNIKNDKFLGGKYSEKNRKLVGDSLVVTDADMTSATESLKTNLVPKSPFADGLKLRAFGVHTSPEDEARHGVVQAQFTLHREPLSKEMYNSDFSLAKAPKTALHEGLSHMGETMPLPTSMVEGGSTKAAFSVALDD